jgi:hypothetical protein
MGHNRVRVVDAKTGVITTVAGNGQLGADGDRGSASLASLGGPASIALATNGSGVTLFIAEYFNGSVRVVDPNGLISTLAEPGRFSKPSRLAYRKGGWLYVASEDGPLTAVHVDKGQPYRVATLPPRARKQT